MEILTIMSEKSSINKVSSIRVLFFYFLYIYKNRVLPIFKQDPSSLLKDFVSESSVVTRLFSLSSLTPR